MLIILRIFLTSYSLVMQKAFFGCRVFITFEGISTTEVLLPDFFVLQEHKCGFFSKFSDIQHSFLIRWVEQVLLLQITNCIQLNFSDKLRWP